MGTLINLFLLALAVGLATSQGPLYTVLGAVGGSNIICSSSCTNGIASGGNVGFTENMKYGYAFNGKTTIIAPSGTQDGISEISISGSATIIGMQKCGALLYLKDIKVTHGSKVYDNSGLEGFPIYFSYDGGKVSPSVCLMSKDSIASINLKRAIVSALQVSSIQGEQRGIFETDIQGTCNTTYYSSASNTYRTVIKDKDLTQCTEHEKTDLFGSSLGLDPVYRGSPFSTATQHSEIKIADSTIKSVANSETFTYQPFGPIDVVTKIIVSMNLDLTKMSMTRVPSLNLLDQSRSIVFEKSTSTALSANAVTLLAATQSALDNLEPVVDMHGAKSYADLIALLKVASKDDILATYRQVKSGTGFDDATFAEKVYINALTAANSGESIEAVVELIKSGTLSDSLTVSWFNSLARAQHPTKEAVVSASNLLNDHALKEGYSGVGSLLRQYLMDTRDFNSPEVEETLNNLGVPLQKMFDDSLSPEDEKLAMASLKGLRNVQYLNSDLLDLTNQIIMDQTVPQRIRAATLVMMQSYAKYPSVEKASENILMDISEDSELRILAFKVFSMNPSSYKATVIQSVLDDKNCLLQIQAFLLSYLSNLRTTVDENKFDQKRFYEGIKTKSSKRMLSDILRYSQSLEYSNQYPILRSGVVLDGEVIYSQRSYLARSSSASLKALIFGRQLHVFDYDIRVENIEPMLEKLFGPEGYFTKKKGSTIDDVKNYVTQAINYAKSKRLNAVDSRSISEKDNENNSGESIYVDIALKVFGYDFGWLAFQGLENEVTYKDIIDAVVDKFDNSISNKTNLELSVKKQIPIIDYERKYATSSGLPISMKIQATSAIKLDMAYTFDLDSYLKNSENSNFAYKFIPSGSLNFNTLLTVDGSAVEVGYKLESLLHTSSGSDISLKTAKGRGFQMTYGVPLDVTDVLSVQSGAYTTVQERGSPSSEKPLITPNVERKTYTKTLEDLNNLGLSVNFQYEYPWNGEILSLLPFSGPSSFSMKFLKIDEKLTKYVLKGNYDFKSPTLKYMKVLFYTPKAEISRALELMVGYDTKTDKKFIAEFRTPSTKINLLSTFIHSDKQNTIEVKYLDGSEHVLNMGVKYDHLDSETTMYSPLFEVAYSTKVNGDKNRHPLVPIFDIEGSFIVKRNANSYPSTVTLKDIAVVTPNNKHSLQGEFTFENNELVGKTSVTTSGVTFDMHGSVSGNYPIYKMDGALQMIRDEQIAKRVLADESDNYEPTSKFAAFIRNIKTFNITTYRELHVESPYVYKSDNRMTWENGYIVINNDVLIKNNELTAYGSISATGILDSVLNANITILPSTEDSGVFILGLLHHSSISDQSPLGYGSLKYVQNKDKRGSNFELNSQLPRTLGQFNINGNYLSTDESFKSILNYGIHDGTNLTADMAIVTNDVSFNMELDSPNPKYKSSMNLHGWQENENIFSFDTKLIWPGPQAYSYLNMDGTMVLDGRDSYMSGSIDFPLAKLVNVQVSIESDSDSETKDGGIATIQFISNEQIVLSEKFKYKLTHGNGELHLFGESIHKESQNIIPISFLLEIKNYIDREKNNGKQIAYRLTIEHDGQKLLYQKFMQVTKRMLLYRQIHKINNDEQKISADIEYNIMDSWNWSYRLKSKVISPRIFHYFADDDQNLMECTTSMKVSGYSLDQVHTLKIDSEDGTTDLYELRWVSNNEKIAFKFYNAEREIRGLGHYSLEPIQGGHHLTYSGELWLDHIADPSLESTISIDAYYSIHDGLSTASNINIFVPSFYDKDMGVKSDIQLFKSWENPLSVKLELNIFPTTEQTLKVSSNLNRNVQDNGVLYSADLLANSDGMQLDYVFKDSILIANKKWGTYLDAYFIDSDNIKRPIQLHMELVPKGFISKINIFDVSVIDVTSSIDIQDDTLMLNSVVDYNDHSYSFDLEMTSYPSFKYIMEWTGKSGNPEQLMLEGSITVDDSAVISATRIDKNGNEAPIGYVTKSLEKENWWKTDNHMNTEQWNLVWKSLKGEFIERFIVLHSNFKNIITIEKNRRRVRALEAKKAIPQYHLLVDYTRDEWHQIFNEIGQDDYLPEIPMMIRNLTKAMFAEAKHIDNDVFRVLNRDIENYLKNIHNYYKEQINLLVNEMKRDYDELVEEIKLVLFDVYKMLLRYSDKSLSRHTRSTTEPHSFREYVVDIIYKLIISIDELNNKIDDIQDKSLKYIQSLPIYDIFRDQIEKLKLYPYKEKLWEEIHNYLQGVEMSAPTPEFASFMKTLDAFINHVIHDYPESQNDIPILRNKGILVAKSIVFSFTDYVSYDRAMTMYRALNRLSDMGNTILYIISPNSPQASSQGQNMFLDMSEYIQRYYGYLTPSNLLPPFGVQGVIIASTNIITYNGLPYSFKPSTGSYVLARDLTNDKFSILGNYNDNILTSISVLSGDDGDVYELLSGGKVTFNGQGVDFPLISDHVKTWTDVYSFGIDMIVGVSIKSTYNFDNVEVFINGYYYGKVFGLLGSMYQEPTFDSRLPDGQPSESMESFLLAYKESGNTKPTVVKPVETDLPLSNSLFSENSPLRGAFKTVDPTPYRVLSNQLVSSATSEKDALNKACLVAKAYVSMAKQNFVSNINIPDMCVTTMVQQRSIDATTQFQMSGPSDVADVMILFEETDTIKKPLSGLLSTFIDQITKRFNQKGMKDVNVIVIGYSSGSDVHIYTASGNNDYSRILTNVPEWSEPKSNSPALTSQFIQSYKKVIGKDSKDKAYKLSADYPFRTNAVKAVLSIAQSIDTQNYVDTSQYTFDYIASSYLEQGITFNLIAPINLSDSSDTGIFGASGENIIYTTSAPQGKESRDGYLHDKSLETSLALKTDGVIYDIKFFVDATDKMMNAFSQSIAQTIVENASEVSDVEKSCTVSLYNGVMPYAKCTVVTE